MKDRKKLKYNSNFLSDDYYVFGEGYPAAAPAFRQIEANSYSIDADASILSVLTSIQKKGISFRQSCLTAMMNWRL